MSNNKPHRSWKQDGTCMPFQFKSRAFDGTYVEKGTPIVSLKDVDLLYLAKKPASEKDVYDIKGQAATELKNRNAARKALEQVEAYMGINSGRKGLLRLAATL